MKKFKQFSISTGCHVMPCICAPSTDISRRTDVRRYHTCMAFRRCVCKCDSRASSSRWSAACRNRTRIALCRYADICAPSNPKISCSSCRNPHICRAWYLQIEVVFVNLFVIWRIRRIPDKAFKSYNKVQEFDWKIRLILNDILGFKCKRISSSISSGRFAN